MDISRTLDYIDQAQDRLNAAKQGLLEIIGEDNTTEWRKLKLASIEGSLHGAWFRVQQAFKELDKYDD